MREPREQKRLPHVVILGAGFGGLTAAQSLRRAPVRVTVVDRRNHHLFQPLLYQVAMAGLSPADIASPIRSVLRGQRNATVLLAEVTSIDLERRVLQLSDGTLEYDYLIYAPGTQNSYFGHDEWERFAPGLKSIEDAVEIRRRVLVAFERAERAIDDDERKRLLTFVVIGGGPTGVELAGAIAELSKTVLAREFRRTDPARTKVILIEAGPRILPSFDEELSLRAVDQLSDLGVDVRLGARVNAIDQDGVVIAQRAADGRAETERVEARTVLWGAGVAPTPLAKTLGVPLDRGGRVIVEPDLTLPGHREAFAIGDAVAFLHTPDGKPLPGVSPVAMQQARTVARSIVRAMHGEAHERFEYFDKGTMATIGRKRAIAQTGALRLTGFAAWLTWLVVHIWYLIGFRNRLAVMFGWAYSYFTYKRGARLITDHWKPPEEREAPQASVRAPIAGERPRASA
ncbi:MAG: NAD(P)/FAD-dependent oxidoreductase [Deltaproteobacteria bacterium]|nr:NAD(P)/FAD-dependent oxidoreductase [Deltaproteobacteria bacterium]